MAICKILLVALSFSAALAAPQNLVNVLRAVPFNAVPASHAVVAAAPTVVRANPTLVEAFDSDPSYQFGYSVSDTKTGDSKTREETRNGDLVTGSYTVADPDGRIRRVTYTADAVNGFQAVVTYDGESGPPAIPIASGVSPILSVGRNVFAAAPAPALVHQAIAPSVVRTVAGPAVVHANPTVVTHDATHRVHTAAVPHLVHHQQVASPATATFLRNADGSLTQVHNGDFAQFNHNGQSFRQVLPNAGQTRFISNGDLAQFSHNGQTFTQVGNAGQGFAQSPFGLRSVPLNAPFLRSFPGFNGAQLAHF